MLDYITEASCIIVTYDSDKCYVYAISATNRLVIALSLNLIIFLYSWTSQFVYKDTFMGIHHYICP